MDIHSLPQDLFSWGFFLCIFLIFFGRLKNRHFFWVIHLHFGVFSIRKATRSREKPSESSPSKWWVCGSHMGSPQFGHGFGESFPLHSVHWTDRIAQSWKGLFFFWSFCCCKGSVMYQPVLGKFLNQLLDMMKYSISWHAVTPESWQCLPIFLSNTSLYKYIHIIYNIYYMYIRIYIYYINYYHYYYTICIYSVNGKKAILFMKSIQISKTGPSPEDGRLTFFAQATSSDPCRSRFRTPVPSFPGWVRSTAMIKWVSCLKELEEWMLKKDGVSLKRSV